MRTLITIVLLFAFPNIVFAQLGGFGERLKQKAKQAVERQTDKAMDKVIGKGESKVDEKVNDAIDGKGKKGKAKNQEVNKPVAEGTIGANGEYIPNFEPYKNFDFVPGEKVIFFDDFSTYSNGTAPTGWNKNYNASVKALSGTAKWLTIKGGAFYPEGLKTLPENFTLQLDLAAFAEQGGGTFSLRFIPVTQTNLLDPWLNNASAISFSPSSQIPKKGVTSLEWKDANGEHKPLAKNELYIDDWHKDLNPTAKIAIAKNGSKVSVYINQHKVWDNVELFIPNFEYRLAFHFQDYFVAETEAFLTNLKVATNTPSVKADLNKGKFTTSNILFDTNSDHIKPQSYSILKDVAVTLKANPNYVIKIIGHTDSDGDDASNLVLSQKRALAVKNILSSAFDVDVTKITTDGKGESQPVDNNNTAQGKANNRRVEFIKTP